MRRTHTFKSYHQSPVFSSYLPVVFLDSQYNDVLPASTSDIVALSGGAQLSSNFCRVKNAYRRNRGGSESDWTALAGETGRGGQTGRAEGDQAEQLTD